MGPAFNRPQRLMAPANGRSQRPWQLSPQLWRAVHLERSHATEWTSPSNGDPSHSSFTINLSGCFLVGLLIAALVDRHHAPHWLRIGLVVGFCGAYTTFSTFAQETYGLVEEKALGLALLNATASVGLGMLAVLVGARVGRLL